MVIGGDGRVSSGARRGISGPVAAATACVFLLCALVLGLTTGAIAAVCGGPVVCQCGDTVGADYAMTADLGPCPRLSGTDTVGLKVRSDVTLDCQNHSITGPGDTLKDSFGIRVGTSSGASNMKVKRCNVSGFWWGIYVESATNVLIKGNHLHDNGWKSATENGTGYGLDVANSTAVTVRGTSSPTTATRAFISPAPPRVTRGRQCLPDNGLEQLYLIRADNNTIRNNEATGGTQGLEMRFSSGNAFSYNVWAGLAAPLRSRTTTTTTRSSTTASKVALRGRRQHGQSLRALGVQQSRGQLHDGHRPEQRTSTRALPPLHLGRDLVTAPP